MRDVSYLEFVEWRELPALHIPQWWDRPRWWLVKLLGGTNPNDTVKVIRVPVDAKDFMTRLWNQKRALVEQFRRRPTTLLIGMEDYQELMNSPAVRDSFMFHASFDYGKHKIYDLTVKVIPWMRGIVVMP